MSAPDDENQKRGLSIDTKSNYLRTTAVVPCQLLYVKFSSIYRVEESDTSTHATNEPNNMQIANTSQTHSHRKRLQEVNRAILKNGVDSEEYEEPIVRYELILLRGRARLEKSDAQSRLQHCSGLRRAGGAVRRRAAGSAAL